MVSSMRVLCGFLQKSKYIPSPRAPSSLSPTHCLLRGFSFGSSVRDGDDGNDVTRSSSKRSVTPMSFSSGEAESEYEEEEEPSKGKTDRMSATTTTRYKPNPNDRLSSTAWYNNTQRGDRMEQQHSNHKPTPSFDRQNMGPQGSKPPTPPPRSNDGDDSHRLSRKFLNFDNLNNLDSGKQHIYGNNNQSPARGASTGNHLSEYSFLERFRLGAEKTENPPQAQAQAQDHSGASATTQFPSGKQEHLNNGSPEPELQPEPEDADAIFKKMKEHGLIPNAVAMLDGLCKDGLVQEAMKLFGSMREKGTFPEVVIYTAVMEGFCKAQKLDDTVRIFRKMETNGISPNAFTYSILIQGLYKNKRLEDAANFCVEMLRAGHSPNVATFVGLVDWFCRERGVEEAQNTVNRLSEVGYLVEERAIREFLDKRGPFLPSVWEAIFGKKCSQQI